MQTSDLPTRISTPFAESAVDPTYRNTVPIPSQISITPGRASFVTGFPPLNFLDVGAGGVPPFGSDMNGLLYAMTQWLRWSQAGAVVPWDSTFSAAISGYPLGAIVASATTPKKFWVSTTENNVTNPDSAGAGWEEFYVGASGATAGTYRRGVNLTVRSDGSISAIANAATPIQTELTVGVGNYTTPANATRLKVIVQAAGGGSGTTLGGSGATSSFNSVTAIGGQPGALASGAIPGAGGLGGTGGVGGGTLIIRRPGQRGGKGAGGAGVGSAVGGIVFAGGMGGSSLLGPGASADEAPPSNSGAGAGGITNSNNTAGPGAASGGGGAGEGYEMWIYGPSALQVFPAVVGAGGAAGTAGFAGANGKIIVVAFFD